jgi:hypothetical protein
MKQAVIIKDFFELNYGRTVNIIRVMPFLSIIKAHGERESTVIPSAYIKSCDSMFDYSTPQHIAHEG